MKDAKPFRTWVNDIWRENRAEYEMFNQKGYSLEEYFNRYKYWLKREYRYQLRQQKHES
jgi:hypothetical protein